MRIYKIVTATIWRDALEAGQLIGMPVDLADGYIHFSSATQLRETAAKHFAGQTGLMLLGVSAERLGAALKWEVSRGGQLFPHLYGPLSVSDVDSAVALAATADGKHLFPDDVP